MDILKLKNDPIFKTSILKSNERLKFSHQLKNLQEHLKNLQFRLLKFISKEKLENYSKEKLEELITILKQKCFIYTEDEESIKNEFFFDNCYSRNEEKLCFTLLLDCLLFYAENQSDDLRRLMNEKFPFFHTCKMLIRSLCDILALFDTSIGKYIIYFFNSAL